MNGVARIPDSLFVLAVGLQTAYLYTRGRVFSYGCTGNESNQDEKRGLLHSLVAARQSDPRFL